MLNRVVSPGEVNRILKGLGFKLYYDCYDFPRPDPKPHPNWQSESLAAVSMYRNGEEVDAQEECDEIRIGYLLATLDSALIDPYLALLDKLRDALGGQHHPEAGVARAPYTQSLAALKKG